MGMHEGREEDERLLAGGHERRDEWTVLAFVGSAYNINYSCTIEPPIAIPL